jgi:hypothetical protein
MNGKVESGSNNQDESDVNQYLKEQVGLSDMPTASTDDQVRRQSGKRLAQNSENLLLVKITERSGARHAHIRQRLHHLRRCPVLWPLPS